MDRANTNCFYLYNITVISAVLLLKNFDTRSLTGLYICSGKKKIIIKEETFLILKSDYFVFPVLKFRKWHH